MDEEPVVIYVARTVQDAYLLKNLLADEQIETVVFNNLLEGGAGVDILGWPTSARVAVAPAYAEQARQIATQFDARLAASAKSPMIEEPAAEPPPTVADWPRCPECDAPRATRCPSCGATGTNFRPADPAAVDILSDNAAAEAASCVSCGPCGCTGGQAAPGSSTSETPDSQEPEAALPAPGLVCNTCDEPFVPEYTRRCLSCSHEFADGIDIDAQTARLEPVNARVVIAIVGVIALIAAIGIYFAMLL
jgi:hypothetical protein